MSKENKTYKIAGLMSGTSLDGLDLCIADFWQSNQQWKFNIVSAETIEYTDEWIKRLSQAQFLSGLELAILDREYGCYLGQTTKSYLEEQQLKVDYLASHGHTVFHQTERQLSLQIGHGAFLSAASGIDSISDFRSLDTAYGGEGAPLVPVAEKFLFPENKTFLNIGGITNISIHTNEEVIGFDICPSNQVLNYLSKKYFDKEFDENGSIAQSGLLDKALFKQLNQLDFYQKSPPKSLGREFTEEKILPILNNSKANGEDLIHTYTKHIAFQIAKIKAIKNFQTDLMITGGGAHNKFLCQEIKSHDISSVEVDKQIIEFKEALCFAFLGLLRILKKPNVYSSISGASKDNIGGSIFLS